MARSSVTSIPANLHLLLVDLHILAAIEKGKKINTNGSNITFVDADSWIGSITRRINGEGRRNLLYKLDQIIQSSIIAINEYQGTEFLKIIVNALGKAGNGVARLISTYEDDYHMVAEIQIYLKNIDLQLEKYKHLLEPSSPFERSSPIAIRDTSEIKSSSAPTSSYIDLSISPVASSPSSPTSL